jgi:hypothetical protein
MRRTHVRAAAGLLSAALLALTAALGLPLDAFGQEATPTATEEGAAPATQPALILQPPADMPLSVDDEFEVRLDIENVEHLAAFDSFIMYDSEKLEWLGGEVGPFFTDQERQDQCLPEEGPRGEIEFHGAEGDISTIADALKAQGLDEQSVAETTAADGQPAVIARVTVDQMGPAIELGTPWQTRVVFDCVTLDPPISAGGPPGLSGSGTLGIMRFRAIKSGDAKVDFGEQHTLAPDDLDENGELQAMGHSIQGTVIEISGGGGFPWLIAVIIAVVAVVVIGGGAGYWYARGRSAGAPPPPPPSI